MVPAASLIDRLWDSDPPDGARSALQSLVSRLRGALGGCWAHGAIESHLAGYRLVLGRGEVDALVFEELAVQGSRALAGGDPARASALLREALGLWRGPALAGLPETEHTARMATRLEELRRGAVADRIEADLASAAASAAAGLAAELRAMVAEDPLAERPRALLMRALYLAGRQADALAVYADARAQLADRLGVDPSPQLEQVYLGVLRQSLPGGASEVGSAREVTKAAERDAAARPPSTAPAAALHTPLTSFVDRDEQTARVAELAGQARLVTLTGPGGVGKTRLAAEVAGWLAAQHRGVWLVELAPLGQPGDVPYTALTALGIRDAGMLAGTGPGAAPAPDPLGRLVGGLRERSGLIVLDNCEHLILAAAELADAVLSSCPGIRVLATSREALGITGETVWPVPPLPVPGERPGDGGVAAIATVASVRLLADRARAAAPGFVLNEANVADVARICRALDGMPLAIELAAARLRTLSPGQLADRLSDRFALLTGGSRTALPRHQTLRAVVEWSWDLLSEAERMLARRLAALPAGATLGAAEAVCADEPAPGPEPRPGGVPARGGALPPGRVLDALTGLVDKSFLSFDAVGGEGGRTDGAEPRYRMLETVRAYSLERLAEAGEQSALRHRICDYYLGLAETADPLLRTGAQRHWFNVLVAESDNMLAALRWAIERRDEDTALRFVAALGWYWLMFGLRGDSASLARAALALGAGERAADRAKAEARAVCALVGMGTEWDLEGLREPLAAAFAAAGADPSGQAPHPLVAVAGASVAVIGGDGERALELITAYLDAADPWIRAAARLQRVVYACNLGRIEEAAADCAVALADFREIGEIYGTTMALMMRAELDLLTGDCGGAIAALGEAIGLGRQLADWGDVGYLYGKLAAVRIRTGDHAAARADLDRAVTAQQPGETDFFLRLVRAELAWREGDLPGALRLGEDLAAGLAGKPAAAWAPMRALVGARLGVLRLEAGDPARASAALRDALQAAVVTRDRPATAAAVQGLASAALRLARPARAAELLGAADSIRGTVDHSSLDAPGIRAAARERLGPAAFDAAYRRGRAMIYDAAVAFAEAGAADAGAADAGAAQVLRR